MLVALLATGCFSASGGERDSDARSAAIETALASVQQYPGARLVDRHDGDVSSEFQYELPATVTGSQVQLHFRRLLGARHWRCSFHERAAGESYGFFCQREDASLNGKIADRGGYTLAVQPHAQ